MKSVLKKYAEGMCSSLSVWHPEDVLKGSVRLIPAPGDQLCVEFKDIEGFADVRQDVEWDNISCYIIDLTVDKHVCRNIEVHLIVQVSRIATVACAYWLSCDEVTIEKNNVKMGKVISESKLGSKAKRLKVRVFDILSKAGYFTFPVQAFDFELRLHSDGDGKANVLTGNQFFFGNRGYR